MMWNRKGTEWKPENILGTSFLPNILCVPDMYKEFEFVSCWQMSLYRLGKRQASKRELV